MNMLDPLKPSKRFKSALEYVLTLEYLNCVLAKSGAGLGDSCGSTVELQTEAIVPNQTPLQFIGMKLDHPNLCLFLNYGVPAAIPLFELTPDHPYLAKLPRKHLNQIAEARCAWLPNIEQMVGVNG